MLEKITALKEDLFSLKSKVKILVLVGVLIILLGGVIISISYLSKSDNKMVATMATTTSTLLRPDWDPQTRDICGDGICGITEEAGGNMCSKDCSNRPLAIDNFVATPAVVTPGQTAVLSWSSTASFCASSGSEDAWFVTGGAPSGTVPTTPLQMSKTYTLSCMNNAGELQTKEVTVMVESPTAQPIAKKNAPTITFTATPSTINAGQSTTLFWVVANATSCTASGGAQWGWTGARGTKGTQVTPALTISETYSLTCRGAGGSTTKNTRVTVNRSEADGGAPLGDFVDGTSGTGSAPYVTFRTSPTTVVAGKTTTISWYSSDAASCTAGGDGAGWGWKGAIPTSGAKITPALSENQTFAITCTSAQGGAITKNASVEVTPLIPKPTVTFTGNGVAKPTIVSGEKVTLVWSSENATSCNTTDYGGEEWDWHGELGLSGTRTSPALTSGKTYNIKCIGAGGYVTKYVTVIVPYVKPKGKLPKVELNAWPPATLSGIWISLKYTMTPPEEGAKCEFNDQHTFFSFRENEAIVCKDGPSDEEFTIVCHTENGDIKTGTVVKGLGLCDPNLFGPTSCKCVPGFGNQ